MGFVSACGMDEGRERVVGFIDTTAAAGALVAPDTGHNGTPVLITVTTWGSMCRTADGMSTRVSGLTADVTPYDLAPPPGISCLEGILRLPRTKSLAFATPGQATIRLHGRDGTGAVTVERSITILP
jgi:hypothetical protein